MSATRRGLLQASGLLAGTGVGVISASAAAASATGSSLLPAVLVARQPRVARPGSVYGKQVPPGTPALPFGDLCTVEGESHGRFDTSHMDGREPMHLQRFVFDDGALVGFGPAHQEGEFTVVGAAGRLAGTSGGYTVRRIEDGALEFTFDNLKVV